MIRADEFLGEASGMLELRGQEYDSPDGERSIESTVKAFNAITGQRLSAREGWMFMCLLKIVRTTKGEFKKDSFVDLAAYAALMGEEASTILDIPF